MSKGHGFSIELSVSDSSDIEQDQDGSISLSLPMTLQRRKWYNQITLPDGTTLESRPWDDQPTHLQQALARAFRWQALIDSGKVDSVKALGTLMGVDPSYVSRIINLTVLSPDILEAILDDDIPDSLNFFKMAVNPALLWEDQLKLLS